MSDAPNPIPCHTLRVSYWPYVHLYWFFFLNCHANKPTGLTQPCGKGKIGYEPPEMIFNPCYLHGIRMVPRSYTAHRTYWQDRMWASVSGCVPREHPGDVYLFQRIYFFSLGPTNTLGFSQLGHCLSLSQRPLWVYIFWSFFNMLPH